MITAALFDYSGTLFRLDYTPESLERLLGEHAATIDADRKAALLRKLTAPAGAPVELSGDLLDAWHRRDLDPELHRCANVAILEASGLSTPAAEQLYRGMLDDENWHAYPDTAETLKTLHEAGIRIAVVSNIAWDVRTRFARSGLDQFVDAYVLSFEHGVQKPDPEIFRIALAELDGDPAQAVMVGDSEAADGGSRAVGVRYERVEPLPTDARPDALIRIARAELGS